MFDSALKRLDVRVSKRGRLGLNKIHLRDERRCLGESFGALFGDFFLENKKYTLNTMINLCFIWYFNLYS